MLIVAAAVVAAVRVQRVSGRRRPRRRSEVIGVFVSASRHRQRDDSGHRSFLVHRLAQRLHRRRVVLAQQRDAVDVDLRGHKTRLSMVKINSHGFESH